MSAHARAVRRALAAATLFATALASTPASAQSTKTTVISATPASGAPGAQNLDVTIGGSGFAPDSTVYFYVSRTSDPGAITVDAVRYVSPEVVVATIDIAQAAAAASYDIVVSNPRTRSGKGTDLFRVEDAARGGAACLPLPNSQGYTELAALNQLTSGGTAAYSLGGVIHAYPTTVGGAPVLMVAVHGGGGVVQVFFLANEGGTLTRDQVHPHRTITLPLGSVIDLAIADVNGDQVPDVIATNMPDQRAVVLRGQVLTGHFDWSATPIILTGAYLQEFGYGIAAADLDGDGRDEVAISQESYKSGKTVRLGAVNVFKIADSGSWTRTVVAPPTATGVQLNDRFGRSVALADVNGDGHIDVIAGAPGRTIQGITAAGAAFVIPGPVPVTGGTHTPAVVELRSSTLIADQRFGRMVRTSRIGGGPERSVLATSDWGLAGSTDPHGDVFKPFGTTPDPAYRFLPASPSEAQGWARSGFQVGEITGDAYEDVVLGAPHASVDGRCGSGSVYVFRGAGAGLGWAATDRISPTYAYSSSESFGWDVAIGALPPTVAGAAFDLRLILVTNPARALDGRTVVGDVVVYGVN